jgi:hypothetical protein
MQSSIEAFFRNKISFLSNKKTLVEIKSFSHVELFLIIINNIHIVSFSEYECKDNENIYTANKKIFFDYFFCIRDTFTDINFLLYLCGLILTM